MRTRARTHTHTHTHTQFCLLTKNYWCLKTQNNSLLLLLAVVLPQARQEGWGHAPHGRPPHAHRHAPHGRGCHGRHPQAGQGSHHAHAEPHQPCLDLSLQLCCPLGLHHRLLHGLLGLCHRPLTPRHLGQPRPTNLDSSCKLTIGSTASGHLKVNHMFNFLSQHFRTYVTKSQVYY